jgi:hypothetical protein
VQLGTFGAIDQAALDTGPEVYRPFFEAGIDVIATDMIPIAALMLREYEFVPAER